MSDANRHLLRERLADSHVAAVAVAVLLLWSLDAGFRALWAPLTWVTEYLINTIAILDVPSYFVPLTIENRFRLLSSFSYIFAVLCNLASAWSISRWVYGTGPIKALSLCCARLTGGNCA